MRVYEDDLRNEVRVRLKEDLDSFYQEDFLNYEGSTLDSKKKLTEVIADELVKNYDQVSKIGKNADIRRTRSFNRNHDGVANVKARMWRFGNLEYNEKLLAIALYNSRQGYCLGEIFDYEVPIKEKQTDKYGRVDLVSKDRLNHSVKLIELKIKPENGNGETLLRALLEIYTYYKLISGSFDKFLRDYSLLPAEYLQFQPAMLVEEETLSGKTLSDLKKHPRIETLIARMTNEIGMRVEGYVFDYPRKIKPFQSSGEDKQKIMLQGNISIEQII
ncbi:MAG: hypothetical protein ABFD82_00415 [Syntrophaceae bacterium]